MIDSVGADMVNPLTNWLVADSAFDVESPAAGAFVCVPDPPASDTNPVDAPRFRIMGPLKQLGRYAPLRKVDFGFRIPSSDKGFAKVRVSKPRQKRQARRDGVVELREEDGADADGRVEIPDDGA